jgi:uncharacterized repeat protein (TIGR03847 family)
MIYDLRPISHITVDTIGRPGERVFYLQASRGGQVVTLIIEKQHALALASGLDDLLSELGVLPASDETPVLKELDLELRQPVEPLFRVGQMGLSYDENSDLVVLVAYQLAAEDIEDVPVVRFWGTRQQMRSLRNQALVAVEGGRPTCTLCGEIIDPDGHLCPRKNGHGNHPSFSV